MNASTQDMNSNLLEEAALWLVRGEDGRLTPDERANVEAWLTADPRRQAAYDSARLAWELSSAHAAHPEMLALRGAALSYAPRAGLTRFSRMAAVVSAGVLLLGWGGATLTAIQAPASSRAGAVAATIAPTLPRNAALYRTTVGERSTVVLPDGSTATLNTDSVLKVSYSGKERGVRLLRGQALFEVAKNHAAPFRVYAAGRSITAVGTVFDVRLDGQSVKVALVEGVVTVAPTSAEAVSPQSVIMNAGQMLAVAPATPAILERADIRRATSWKDGVVVFDDAPLADAVAEINRYAERPLKLAEPQIGSFRVSGVFKTGDPQRFATSMTEVFPLTVERSWDGSAELHMAHAGKKTSSEP